MSGWYRFGAPGEDTVAHLNTGRKHYPKCGFPRFPEDDPRHSDFCQRIARKLCDAPRCDKPICDLHATTGSKADTDFWPDHKELA